MAWGHSERLPGSSYFLLAVLEAAFGATSRVQSLLFIKQLSQPCSGSAEISPKEFWLLENPIEHGLI